MKTLSKAIAFCLALAPVVVFGNLGDNELKISQTYGSPTEEQKLSQSLVIRHYRSNGMAITVTFLNGTSQCETFKKLDGAPLTDDQIQSFLEANANNLSWTQKTSAVENTREWTISGAAPSPDSSSSDYPKVFAVSGKYKASEGTEMVAVDTRKPDNDSSAAETAPQILRKAAYKSGATNNVLAIFTSAYERVAKRELRQNKPAETPNQ